MPFRAFLAVLLFTTGHLVAVADAADFAYVANASGANISGYAIASATGILTPLPGSPFADAACAAVVGSCPLWVTPDPAGKFLYVIESQVGTVSVFSIDPSSGALAPVLGSTVFVGGVEQSISIHPSGKFAYVTDIDSGNITAFTINSSTGKLTPIVGSPYSSAGAACCVSFHPNGGFLYVGTYLGSLFAFTVNTNTGALTALPGSPFAGGSAVEVHPSGSFLYTGGGSPQGNQGIGYAINSITGALTPISGSSFTIEQGEVIDPTGKFLYTTLSGTNGSDVFGYTINASTGSLSPVPGSPFTGGSNTEWMVLDPTGKYVYAVNVSLAAGGAWSVWGYSINSASGSLTTIQNIATGLGPEGITTVATSSSPTTGTITVASNISAATFTITGPATYNGSGTSFTQTNAPVGLYTIAYGNAAGYTKPPNDAKTLTGGGSITFTGTYQLNPVLFGPPGPTNPQGISSEPVSTATGNYFTSHTDLAVPGKGSAFAFTRFYNSLDPYSGPIGVGWTHSLNLVLAEDGGTGVVTIKESDGHQDSFSPVGGGAYVPAIPGLFDTLKKNPGGSFTLTRKNQTLLNFSSGGKLLTIVDRNGNTRSLSYTGPNLTTLTDSSGRVFIFSYDVSNRVTSLSDPLGRTLQYTYDSAGNLSSFRDALGGTTQYTYDTNHHMLTATDPRGNVYLQNAYDVQGRVTQQKNARGFATAFAYNTPAVNTTSITDPLGNTTKHVYNTSLQLTGVVDAQGGITAYVYNSNNLKTSTTDPLGRIQTFGYDSTGNLLTATDPAGKTTSLLYDAKNNLLRVTDRLGRVTAFVYDSKDNLLSITNAAAGMSLFGYDGAGQVLTVNNARNFSTGFAYDAAGNLTRVTDALGGAVQMSYDAVGRLLAVKNQLGNTAARTYDANNRLLSVVDPMGDTTQFSYDPNGNLRQITDANGKLTRYAYDSTNKLSQVTDAIGAITAYLYDGNTDLVSVVDAKGHTTSYTYDPLLRLKTATNPLGKSKTYDYDPVGNVKSTLDGNGKTNDFAYDALNRLVSMALSDGKNVAYAYDGVGNRLSMTDWRGVSSYSYDVLNRVLSVTTPDAKVVGYGYDSVGNRISLKYPSGKNVLYQYDALNRLVAATDWNGNTTAYAYDAAGNLRSTNQPNRTSSSYAYDAANRLLSVENDSKDKALSAFSYVLDKVGNRLQVTDSRGDFTRYGYDSLYRLTSWTPPASQVTQYVYDAVGNRTLLVSPTGTINYTYDPADELLAAGSITFGYDGNGNQISKAAGGVTTNYAWDALNRLSSVTGGGINTEYAYDGDGNRVLQQIPTGSYQYTNDLVAVLPVVLNENGPDGNIDYVNGLSLISESVASDQFYYQGDGLGSVIDVTNHAGAHQANYGYDPWGQDIRPMEPPFGLDALGTTNKYKFTDLPADSLGLSFATSRYYDSSVGRFISRDPILKHSPFRPWVGNAYQYALNAPTRFSDPHGLSAVEPVLTFGLSVISPSNVVTSLSTTATIGPDWCDTINCVSGVETIIDAANASNRDLGNITVLPGLGIGAYQDFTSTDPGHAFGRLGVNSGVDAGLLGLTAVYPPAGLIATVAWGTANTFFPGQINGVIDTTNSAIANSLLNFLMPQATPINYTTPLTLLRP